MSTEAFEKVAFFGFVTFGFLSAYLLMTFFPI
jgi:hypothetical protein